MNTKNLILFYLSFGMMSCLITDSLNASDKKQKNLDPYSALIVSQYLESKDDHARFVQTNKKFKKTHKKFRYNPRSITPSELQIFPNIETLHLYTKQDIENWIDYEVDQQFINNLSTKRNLRNNQGKFHAIEVEAPVSYLFAKRNLGKLKKLLKNEDSGSIKFYNVETRGHTSIGKVNQKNGKFEFNENLYSEYNGDIRTSDKTYYIRTIPESCFNECNMRCIDIPNSVRSIEDYAFSDCYELAEVKIPNSVTSIKRGAFNSCSNLHEINIPYSVQSIGEEAFRLCNNLKSIIIPNTIKSIKHKTFYGCSSLESIIIPQGIKSIGMGAFAECIGLKSVTIPDSVYYIFSDAFDGCNNEDLQFHVSSENMKAYLVNNCKIDENKIIVDQEKSESSWIWDTDLDGTLHIPDGVTEIDDYMFLGRSDIQSVIIPNGVKSIGWMAFDRCRRLTYISIPDSVCYIDLTAFDRCHKDLEFHVPSASMKNYLESKFKPVDGYIYTNYEIHDNQVIVDREPSESAWIWDLGLDGVLNISSDITEIAKCMFYGRRDIKSITIPDRVISIGDSAFAGCSGLNSIIIPDSVRSIGKDAFIGVRNAMFIVPNERVKNLLIENGVNKYRIAIQEKEQWLLPVDGKIVVPAIVEHIEDGMFEDRLDITSVEIQNGVKSISNGAFSGCSKLESIFIPDSVTSIRSRAFQGCSSLKSITIPNSVKFIDYKAFDGCKEAGFVVPYKAMKEHLLSTSGINATRISVAGADDKKNEWIWPDDGNIITPNTIESIGFRMFLGRNDIKSIIISESVKSIYDCAFGECKGLMNVTISDGVTSIGSRVFIWCGELTSVTIPNSVTSIGESAFYGCKKLNKIYVHSERVKRLVIDSMSGINPDIIEVIQNPEDSKK